MNKILIGIGAFVVLSVQGTLAWSGSSIGVVLPQLTPALSNDPNFTSWFTSFSRGYTLSQISSFVNPLIPKSSSLTCKSRSDFLPMATTLCRLIGSLTPSGSNGFNSQACIDSQQTSLALQDLGNTIAHIYKGNLTVNTARPYCDSGFRKATVSSQLITPATQITTTVGAMNTCSIFLQAADDLVTTLAQEVAAQVLPSCQ